MPDVKALYDEDFVAWSRDQAEALRSAGRTGSNHKLDWENLAEEIESLGTAQRSAIGSHIMRIIQHLTKLEHSPADEPRRGWRRSVRLARIQIERRLEDNPSLKAELNQIVEDEMRRGIEYAIADLEEYGEFDEVGATALRRARYTPEQILGDWFPPEPQP
ncbi:MAG TPA: DUF29 domain-containing protein [Stellaceae bacterium]|nr:DUF29 domain-containing protein [Stellaceae bacterium]